jgi:hypothetical protein
MVIQACRAVLTERCRLMCKQRGCQHRWPSTRILSPGNGNACHARFTARDGKPRTRSSAWSWTRAAAFMEVVAWSPPLTW